MEVDLYTVVQRITLPTLKPLSTASNHALRWRALGPCVGEPWGPAKHFFFPGKSDQAMICSPGNDLQSKQKRSDDDHATKMSFLSIAVSSQQVP